LPVLTARQLVQLLVAKHARLVEQLVHQRRLAVIDVGDDRDVPYRIRVHLPWSFKPT
jgi:hypothetical protein